MQPVKIVFFSCQDWQAGYYAAHKAIAAEDADLVVGLGDYIYERNFYDGPRKDTLGANRDGEVQTLDEYRAKYRQYKADPNLRAMHAAHSYVAIWDDHEVEDNYAGASPGEETQQVRVPFLNRKANGYRAFYEYMPFEPLYGQPEIGSDLYRRMRVGANVELFLLDERQDRDNQPCGDAFFTPCADAENKPRGSSATARRLAQAPAAGLRRQLEADRQPADDHVAGAGPGRADQQGRLGRLRSRAARDPGLRAGQGDRQRQLPDRRHPHLLRRRRGRERPRARTAWPQSSWAGR